MSFYYTLEVENGIYVFERTDRRDFSSVEWHIDGTYFHNPAFPEDGEIELVDMLFQHSESLKTVWPLFLEHLFYFHINKSKGTI
ncbi:hypothetical protein JRY02_05120 [Enterobacter roggenkampii]|nr:hypothetical protein [Enterobacter roggenkampii]